MAVTAASPQTGSRPAGPLPADETFRLALPPAELTVHSALPGLRAAISGLVHPLFEVGDTLSPTAPRLTVALRPDLPGPQELDSAPQLLVHPAGPRFVVLERSADRTVLLRDGEADSAPLVITATPGTGSVSAEAPDAGPASVRAVVRLLGTLLGAQLTGRGAVFLHGSAVSVKDSSVLMLGPKHRGKSSLAFLAVTLCGADFVSDDILVAWARQPGDPPTLRGWPKRIGIATALLAGHPAREAFARASLRRHRSGTQQVCADTAWSTTPDGRRRLFADLDEFTALTGATVATETRPAGIVLPQADQKVRGWKIIPVSDRAEALDDALLSGPDLRHYTDYLGLLPRPRPEPAVRADVLATLDALPCVRVRYGPDANADFPRFWGEVTAALALPDRTR
ncbi:hypothetical protein HEP86_03445 [Streptomyces sp. RPA4-5]|uniref:hypothetical protein n=1 Tax=Streptomyces sp. RPA4-5 TaxID=2721245 RepID=UPI00143EDA61|nr:hypothetical protein [Streptomyces sp. RPA4-5]QIY53704.1 hypothetical protein HEP86_03445 [Streptomyces sp. RPA4-5]